MKYIYSALLFSCTLFYATPRDSRELRIIHYNLDRPNLQRHDAFRINRSRSLPIIIETPQETIIEIPYNSPSTTVVEKAHSEYKEKKQSCCSKHKAIIWVAMITTGGVISASVMSTIVALVIHFAG